MQAGAIRPIFPLVLTVLTACGPGAPELGPMPLAGAPGELAIAYDAGSRELVLELPPVDLPADRGHHAIEQPPPLEGAIPVDGWVRGYDVELLDRNGQPVPRAVLHHVNIIVPGRRELFSQIMQRLGAAGRETGPVRTPPFMGYPLSRGDGILLSAMLHNPGDRAYEGVRVRVRLPHIDRHVLLRPVRAYPFYLDVMPPAGIHEFDLPPGRSETAWQGEPAVSGRILGAGGHVHKYATSLRLEDVAEGKVIYETTPILDEQGNVVGMPQDLLIWKLGVPIHAGRTYRLSVTYENPTGDTIRGGGMGALGGVMLATGDVEWPTIDPRHPEYLRDVAVTLRQTAKAMERSSGPDAGAHGHH